MNLQRGNQKSHFAGCGCIYCLKKPISDSQKLDQLKQILTPAIEAARERIAEKDSWFNECPKCGSDDLGATYSSSGPDPVGAWDFCVNCRERSKTRFLSREKDDQALIEAGEILKNQPEEIEEERKKLLERSNQDDKP